ncbi:NAP-domain-containing protein [Basidiobolus meristosporus CBS 931.73]|uniref:NAP-domain-containing protein n=1 Tax=Basidiobolus meristosporus CBS 931.73 TaxID=1314790 RepID=A0A1Y1Z383_9FUNG|nr:NAP-domain-containing protein [Basidiobolus meristosporus CBS 931.73]|eukprot:ORY04646.1 NAP-domain-containing protein [Basidiobolus meristosporus CBS 931.73]
MDSHPAGVDIKNNRNSDFVSPTPNNTPSFTSPISSSKPPGLSSLSEEISSNFEDLEGRIGALMGDSANIRALPMEVKERVFALKNLQTKYLALEAKFHMEILELEKKYNKLSEPLFQQRSQIIQGEVQPATEEIEAGKKVDEELTEELLAENEEEVSEESARGIPEFWLTALSNHFHISELITENDQEPLKQLKDIRLSYLDSNPGFKLDFEFSENEYFENSVLSKTYYYKQSSENGELVFDHSEGTKIQWKEGKDLSVTVETKKQRHKSSNKTRVVKRTVPAETFFRFFETVELPDDISETEEDEFNERLDADYELGEEFKEKIIPNAIDWFTGKALEYENMSDDEYPQDFSEGEFDMDEDEVDDDDDDDDDDEVTNPTANAQAPECKQQ